MEVLIIEDEMLLAKRLQKLLISIEPNSRIAGITQGVGESVQWLQQNSAPDLVLMDVELADGQSFDIFKHVQLEVPIIFTTAYDEFAIKAFKLNSVDYLLKPIKENELQHAFKKFKSAGKFQQAISIRNLLLQAEQLNKSPGYRNRFLVKQVQRWLSIDVLEVAFIYSENKSTYLRTHNNQKYIVDIPLDVLERELSPQQFFRANRKYLLTGKSVLSIHTWLHQKLKVEVKPGTDEPIIISRDKANAFKVWMGE
jgi:two-component system, LytTR family, response regulator LytT